jgi:hypothetical protein
MKATKKKVLFIIFPTIVLFFGLCIIATDTNAYNIGDDISLILAVNDVNLDDAVSGTSIPIGTDYTINFFGLIQFHKALTINYLAFVILEAGFPIHEPFRVENLTNVHVPANFTLLFNATAPIAEEFVAIISQIRGTHQLNIIFNYTPDDTGIPEEEIIATTVHIQSENLFEPLATGSGVATVVVTVVTITSVGGSIAGIASAGPAISGKWLAQLKQAWKAIKTSKEASKLSISGIPLSAKIFSGDQLQQFLDLIG